MIDDVDEALRKLVKAEALNGSDVEISFDAPNKEWSSRRNSPAVNIYLYDIHESTGRRMVGQHRVTGVDGRIAGVQPPARIFQLSYLLTAWTQRPEDEHRLLSSLLRCFLRHPVLPDDVLGGALDGMTGEVITEVALPLSQDRSIADVWTALGGELKPSLDLLVIAPVDTGQFVAVGPPVTEQPRFTVASAGADDTANGGRAGKQRQPIVVKGPGSEGLAEMAAGGKASGPDQGEDASLAEETVSGGGRHRRSRRPDAGAAAETATDAPEEGRAFRVRQLPRP